jgi:hypothetical protein
MRLRHRIGRLEVQRRPPAVYPTYAVFGEDGKVERIRLSDGSTLTGRDSIMTYRQLPRSAPLKAYIVGFDPEVAWMSPREAD